jgi:hypothetical protein
MYLSPLHKLSADRMSPEFQKARSRLLNRKSEQVRRIVRKCQLVSFVIY